MSAEEQYSPSEGGGFVRSAIVLILVAYVLGSLYFLYDLHGRLTRLEQKESAAQARSEAQLSQLSHRLGEAESNLKASNEALSSRLGITQKQIAARAAELQRQQQAAEQRIAAAQEQQMKAVTGEVAGVKTELGGAKNDIAANRADLEATKSKLEHALGDLGVQSGLIARTRDELEWLKHRGDRNYFDFTLNKGQKPSPISTVSLQLKKVDPKKGKFTLNVLADDRVIEKKDRTLNEPLQFYSGKNHDLYEIVVFSAQKNQVTGYLSTPKNLPAPATADAAPAPAVAPATAR